MPVDVFVYRTNDPEIVAEWHAYHEEDARWLRKARRLIAHWFPRQGRHPVTQHGWGNISWVGVSGTYRDRDNLPEGWRWDQKNGYVAPFRSRKEGKPFAKLIDENQPPTSIRRRLSGMPDHLFGGRHGLKRYEPGVDFFDGYIWVSWSCQLERTEYDPKIWKRAKRTEWVEHKEAARAAAA